MSDSKQQALSDETSEVVDVDDVAWDVSTDVLVVGAGGTGLVAALAAAESHDITVTILEKADEPGGNTSLSTGMVPAAGTRLQKDAGIEETSANMARDILEKNDYEADEDMVLHLAEQSRHLVHWLVNDWDVDMHLVDDFKYPKHSEYRMHAPPGRNGDNLVCQLVNLLKARENVELLTNAPVNNLVADDGVVVGVKAGVHREEAIDAEKVILATDGFGGNKRMIKENLDEEIEDALYFGADANKGDGIRWGAELDAALASMDSYQGHATVAHQTGVLSTYAIVMNGGILVNERGERFGDESAGYSQFAINVLQQPNGVGYEIFDERILGRLEGEFDDFDEAVELGAYNSAETVEELAETLACDPDATAAAVEAYNEAVEVDEPDEVGRTEGRDTLQSPYYGTKVTGALFHTQGGLVVDGHARVQREDGEPVPNLYAGGGSAVGISGSGAGGYLSGNGLTTALGLGRLAGEHARDALGVRR
jgi:fumarate reductase flavoprotein subunit